MSIKSTMYVQLVSADPAAALRSLGEKGITVFDVTMEADELTCRFHILRQHYAALKEMAQRRGDALTVLRRSGVFWLVKGLLGRPVLCGGLLIILLLSVYLPSRIFFFRVEGNATVPTRVILAAAEECGMQFGISRRDLRSEKMKNVLLETVPQLQWAGINTTGCVATITVRERQAAESTPDAAGVSSIVASRDGVIQQLTVVRGNGVCKVGQAVKAGQVLISGYTDCGISIRATRAEGEIYANTQHQLTVVAPTQWSQRGTETTVTENFSLIFGKKRINLWKDSGISTGSCVKMYSESYLTLPGGFQLPIALVTETYIAWDFFDSVVAGEDSAAMLEDFAKAYLSQQMIAGQVLSAVQETDSGEGIVILRGKYACHEMIGQVRSEEIIR